MHSIKYFRTFILKYCSKHIICLIFAIFIIHLGSIAITNINTSLLKASLMKVSAFFYLLYFHLYNHQGPCHTYIHKRGQTAGWTDVFCQHTFKIGSKMLAAQETVSDPSDVINSMIKTPPVHILGKVSTDHITL